MAMQHTTDATSPTEFAHHRRRKSHYEQEIEVLERDLLDRRPSQRGLHAQHGAQTVPASTAIVDVPIGWTGHEAAEGLPYQTSLHEEPLPCQSSDLTVAATQAGEGPGEGGDKYGKTAAAVAADQLESLQDSWEEDGYLFTKEGRTVWVEFAPDSPKDPFQFPQARKWYITIVAIFYTFATSWNTGAYAVGEPSMEVDTGGTPLQAAAGLGVYAWGFAIFPLVLSSGSEEFGRKPLYVVTGILYWLFFFPIAK
ncbi:hypothetical protein QFC19_002298 [Naganishia cerealis]|uniref:Uncharacterized protein n=1 Tax=Naganishia cerealis TaxID=610337 RepID=A0ACC2WBZ2_9TREE|nr:hypothetical protein QFC19_002298 [Naganishia cerealis]